MPAHIQHIETEMIVIETNDIQSVTSKFITGMEKPSHRDALFFEEAGRQQGPLSCRRSRKIALQGRSSRETKVADIMTRTVYTVGPGTRTREAMALMSDKKIRHVPVVDGETVMGMISIRDLMDDIIADHEQTIAQLESYIQS